MLLYCNYRRWSRRKRWAWPAIQKIRTSL